MTTCPTILRLRKQFPSLLLSQQTRLIGRHLQTQGPVEISATESIALAACLRFWRERHTTAPSPDPDAVALVCGEGMSKIHGSRLRKERLQELACVARQLAFTTYANDYFHGGIKPQLSLT